ncbi:GntR family transcriptional regulator [Bordetella sp. H567]|uniref:GntR family transcriptional regulator n=1 Tax=Bordetella sp. H567 TaxID=1697043 RepID=UPI00081C4D35|nr:GntR family transcriptional regulator [Bordetella sp. H567]AOB30671.1 GntR family transcriptional regulator [Bordetella sp. H567]
MHAVHPAAESPQPIVRQALYLEAAQRLREMIRSRTLAAGEWVDELRVAAQLGISRTPLREALKLLASEGLVRLEPRRGCFVNELSMRDLDDIFPLMAMLEGRCAFEAARKAGPEDIRRLAGLHEVLREHAAAGRIDAYYEANYVIHEAIQALADNRWLSDTIGNLRKVLSLSRHKSLMLPGRMRASCAEHMALFAAIRDHDPERAETVARDHLLRQLDALHAMERRANGAVPTAPKRAGKRLAPEAAKSRSATASSAVATAKEPVHDRSRTARSRARVAPAR